MRQIQSAFGRRALRKTTNNSHRLNRPKPLKLQPKSSDMDFGEIISDPKLAATNAEIQHVRDRITYEPKVIHAILSGVHYLLAVRLSVRSIRSSSKCAWLFVDAVVRLRLPVPFLWIYRFNFEHTIK